MGQLSIRQFPFQRRRRRGDSDHQSGLELGGRHLYSSQTLPDRGGDSRGVRSLVVSGVRGGMVLD